MAEVLVVGKKISEMDLVTDIVGDEKIPTGVVGDKAVTTGQLLHYLDENGKVQWGKIEGDISLQTDLINKFNQQDLEFTNHANNHNNPHQVTKEQVGLGNVDNTSDANKPVSSATQQLVDDLSEDVVHSVMGLKGDVTTQQIKDGLDLGLGSAANYDYQQLPPSDYQKDLNDNLTFPYKPDGLDFGRNLNDRLHEYVSVKDFGAIGDGSAHTIQDWVDSGKFTDLVDIQAKFPFVVNLQQTVDWVAIQYAVKNYAKVYIPKGTYVLSDVVKTLHNTTPYNSGSSSSGTIICGDGSRTQLTRTDPRPATRIMTSDLLSTTRDSDIANLNEACISVHSPYTTITDMSFSNSAVGIYLGQDYAYLDSQISNVSKSNMQRLSFDRVGTSILYLAHGGNHYTNVSDIHFHRCQIDVHLRASHYWKVTLGRGDANNNRNVFTRLRSARSKIGFWNECGDTNSIYSWHAETMPSAANTFPKPDGLPVGITTDVCFMVFSGSNQLNFVTTSFAEAVDWFVYNDGYQNRFVSVGFDETKVTMIQTPREWRGRYASIDKGIGVSDNFFSAFPTVASAGSVYLGVGAPTGAVPLATISITKHVEHRPSASTRGSYTRNFQIELGTVAATTATPTIIWEDSDPSSSANIEVTISATGSNGASYNAKYVVTALRNSARTITRFGGLVVYASRSTGEGVVDTSAPSQISLTLQKDPVVNNRNLQVVLNSPTELTQCSVFVRLCVQR